MNVTGDEKEGKPTREEKINGKKNNKMNRDKSEI